MRTTGQFNSLWELAREQSDDGAILRRRIAVIGAVAVGFCGFLLAIGLAEVVVVFLASIVVSVGVAALLALGPNLRTLGADGIAHLRARSRTARRQLVPRLRHSSHAVRTTAVAAHTHGGGLARRFGQNVRATAMRFAPRPARLEPTREAIRLNATGTQHRRSGRYDEAVDCHRQALEILRALGDRRGTALTQSNLALALSHAGDDNWAVGLFEEAAATLGELGDEEREAQVMANLGLAHRRHGRLEEGDNALAVALEKLTPTSNAYQTIMKELRGAS